MSKDNTFKKLRDNISVICFAVSFIVGWTWVQARLSAVEVLARENKDTLVIVNEIKVDIAVIQKDIEFIKERLKDSH